MGTQTKHLFHQKAAGIATAIFVTLGAAISEAHAGAADFGINKGMLAEIQSLYGLDENQVIERLAREDEAARKNRFIEDLSIASYAGSWFDGKTLNLHVAISDSKDRALVERFDAMPVFVSHSLAQLKEIERSALSSLAAFPSDAIKESYIDYKLNKVVIGVEIGRLGQVTSTLGAQGLSSDSVEIVETVQGFSFSTSVRAADGTSNPSWDQQFPENAPHICSIGASVVGGFVTAGHCGEPPNQIETAAGQALGTVQNSTLLSR